MTPPAFPPPPPTFQPHEGSWNPVALDPPPILLWFKIYMVVLVVLHLLYVVGGFTLGIMADEITNNSAEATTFRLMGLVYVVLGLLLSFLYGFTLFVPRQTWAWILNLVALCVSVFSGCCIFLPIVVLIFWVQEDVRQWYGMR